MSKLVEKINKLKIKKSDKLLKLAPVFDWYKLKNNASVVQFYDKENFLIDSLESYFDSSDPALVIATENITKPLKLHLIKKGSKHKFKLVSAESALSKFMEGGMPNPEKFEKLISKYLSGLSKDGQHVRVFGEMVSLLWKRGNKSGAFQLEALWDQLKLKHNFSICCAYPMVDVGGYESMNDFFNICLNHGEVIPSESYSRLDSSQSRLKEISVLQQKAHTLQREITRRMDYESSLHNLVHKLRISEEFNRNIIESSADGIKVIDVKGVVLSLNGHGSKLLEIEDPSEVIGKKYTDLWRGEYFETAASAFEEAKRGGIGRFQGQRHTLKGTLKWWDVVITPVRSEDGKIEMLVSVSRDITEQKEMEIRKDDFLSATSHELKTPLTIQKGYTQLLRSAIKRGDAEKIDTLAAKIEDQTNKLSKLVTNLLDVAKIQGGRLAFEPESVNIKEIVANVADEVGQMTKSHKITIIGEGDINLFADKDRLKQVVTNLLTNAIKYSPESEEVLIEIVDKPSEVVVCIKDKGIGISKKDLTKIFERFYRGSGVDEKTYPGLGLGLFISSQIIKGHGGRIWVESDKGNGSSFYFSLPLSGRHFVTHRAVPYNFAVVKS